MLRLPNLDPIELNPSQFKKIQVKILANEYWKNKNK